MDWEEIKAAGLRAGLSAGQVQTACLWLTRDGERPTAEDCQKYFHAVLNPKPRKPRPTDGLEVRTTPEEKFGIGDTIE